MCLDLIDNIKYTLLVYRFLTLKGDSSMHALLISMGKPIRNSYSIRFGAVKDYWKSFVCQ